MKIQEIMEAKVKGMSDLEDKDEAPVADPDKDDVPHILMQIKKALDNIDNPSKVKLKFAKGPVAVVGKDISMDNIISFVQKYMLAKPDEKDMLQSLAGSSLDGFKTAMAKDISKPAMPKIKGSRYMSHFSGDFDDK